MNRFSPPEETYQGTTVGGKLAVVFPGKPYRRWVSSIYMSCSEYGPVQIRIGGLSGTLIGSNPYGYQNGYSPQNPRPIPAGSALYVVWPNASVTATGSATLSCEGDQT